MSSFIILTLFFTTTTQYGILRSIMTKGTFLFFLGLFLIALPYLGIPSLWKQYMYVGLGILVVLIGYSLRRSQYLREIDMGNGHRGGETFVETTENLFQEVKTK